MRTIRTSILPILLSVASLASAADLIPPSRPLPPGAYAATTEPQEITLLQAGIASFRQRLLLIESARKTIDTEFYIYESDQAGRLYTQALVRKAREGVKVRVLMDVHAANPNLTDIDANKLAESGIEVRYYNDVPLVKVKKANHRSHRKSLIVDGAVAVVGGRNMADDYFDFSSEYDMLDRDVTVRGSIVRNITQSFENFYNSSITRPAIQVKEPKLSDYGLISETESYYTENNQSSTAQYKKDRAAYFAGLKKAQSLVTTTEEDIKAYNRVRLFGDQMLAISPRSICRETYYYADLPGTSSQARVVADQIQNLMATAQKSLVVESPFFIQNEPANMFQQALNRGVQVDILTNSLYSSDVILTIPPFIATAKTLTASGAKVYVYDGETPRWLETSNPVAKAARWGTHAKGFVLDGHTILVGSFNMDPRSANLNAEMALACRGNKTLADGMAYDLELRKAIAVELNQNGDPVDGRTKFFGVDGAKRFAYFLKKPFSFIFEDYL